MMKKLLFCFLGIFLFPLAAHAQGSSYNTIVISSSGRPIAGAQITVCSFQAMHAIPCTPTTPVYSNVGLTVPKTQPFASDGLGNVQFFASAGNYTMCESGPGLVATCMPITVGGGGGGGGNCSLTTAIPGQILTYAVDGGGTGWTVGDTFFINYGDNTATGTVTSAPGGVVDGITINTPGSHYQAGTEYPTTTTGAGTGLTILVDTVSGTGNVNNFLINDAGACGNGIFFYGLDSSVDGDQYPSISGQDGDNVATLSAHRLRITSIEPPVTTTVQGDGTRIEANQFSDSNTDLASYISSSMSLTKFGTPIEYGVDFTGWSFTDAAGNLAGGYVGEKPGFFSSLISFVGSTSLEQVSLSANVNTAFAGWCLPAADGTAGQVISIASSNTGCGGTQLQFSTAGGVGGTITSPHLPFATSPDTLADTIWTYDGTSVIACPSNNGCEIDMSSTTPSRGWTINSNTGASYNNGTGSVFSVGNTGVAIAIQPFDATASSHSLLRVGGSLVTASNGELGFDTSSNNWHGWNGSADEVLPLSSGSVTDGDCVQWSKSAGRIAIVDSGVFGCGTGGGGGSVTSVATSAPITGGTITTTGTIGCATCVTSAAALTNHAIVLGAGSQATSVLGSLGATTTVLHGNPSGAPTFSVVNLASEVAGQLPITAVGSLGMSGTSPIVVASTGVISCPTCSVTSGTVSSVALTMPGIFSVGGSPITSSGTLAVTLGTESANTVFAGPTTGSAATPTFRAIVPADIPTLNQNTTGNAATATALAATPTQCTGVNFATGIAASGNANCSSPFGSLFYQSVELNGTSQTQRPALNFSSLFTASDSASPARTNIGLGTIPVGNGGTGLTTLTANALLVGNGTGTVSDVTPPPDSQTYFITQTASSNPTTTLAGLSSRTVSGSTDTLLSADRGFSVVYTDASSVAVAVPQANSTGFGSNWSTNIAVEGAGTVTFTPTTSTINGGSSLAVAQGTHCTIFSGDNTNYQALCSAGILAAGTGISLTPGAFGNTISTSAPPVFNCGTTTTCGNTSLSSPRIVIGTVPLSSGTPSTATVTGISPAFTSSSSYVCVATEASSATGNLLKVANVSGSSFTITGPITVTDIVNYICSGN